MSRVSEQPHQHLAELRRRLRQTGGRGRKLRGLLELLRPYRARTLLMLGSLLLATAAALAPPPLAKLAIDSGIVPGDTTALTWIVLAFLATALIYWGATYAQTYLTGWVGQRALQDLRIQLFAHLQTLSVGFYSRRQAGVLISRLTNDVQALDQLVSDGVVTLFGSTLTLVGTAAILIVLDLELALLTFLVFPVLAIGSLAFRIVSADAYRLTREKVAAITAYLQESLSGIRVVRSFAQEQRHLDRFAELNDENREANMKTVNLNAAYFPAVEQLEDLVQRRHPGLVGRVELRQGLDRVEEVVQRGDERHEHADRDLAVDRLVAAVEDDRHGPDRGQQLDRRKVGRVEVDGAHVRHSVLLV